MLLSAVSVLVVAQSSSEIPEGLMNNPVFQTSILLLLPSSPPLPPSPFHLPPPLFYLLFIFYV